MDLNNLSINDIQNILNLLSFFFIYAFLGWCSEVAFAALKHGRFINRGFLSGPVCPIYGFGILLVILMLDPVKDNFMLLFIGSVFLTSILEFITGFILDKLFHRHWWDYSKEKLNICGYVCLRFSLMWGFACLIIVDIVHPAIAAAVTFVPFKLTIVTDLFLLSLIFTDLTTTVIGINRTNKYLKILYNTNERIRDLSDRLGENISDTAIGIVEKGDSVKDNIIARGDEIKENMDKRRERTEEELAELRRKYEMMRGNMPFTARRIHGAFPDLNLLERIGRSYAKKKKERSEERA